MEVSQENTNSKLPLSGVRVLAAEQMQSLPYATQLLASFGAEVIKVEHPVRGDLGRSGLPSTKGIDGNPVGATFLRNNLYKKSIGIDLKSSLGQDLFLRLVQNFDVVAENYKPGTMDRFNLGYSDIKETCPEIIYLSLSGFGNSIETPYKSWPAFAPIAEAMSGIYNFNRGPNDDLKVSPMGALGDTGTGLFAVIGVLTALRKREKFDEGSYIDISMFDSMIAFADIVPNYYSMGKDPRTPSSLINHGFKVSKGEIIIQIGREHQFEAFVRHIGKPEWLDEDRFASRSGWVENIQEIIDQFAIWAGNRDLISLCEGLAAAGVAAAPVFEASDIVNDPHVKAREMLLPVKTSGEFNVLTAGNPVRISGVTRPELTPPPALGADTKSLLMAELSLSEKEYLRLAEDKIVS
jgi:formyl-CoA transferase